MAHSTQIRFAAGLWLATACAIFALGSCSGSSPTVTVQDPTTACTVILAQTRGIVEQAAKIDRAPEDLARQVCAAAVTGADLASHSIGSSSQGIAGASQGMAGASQ